MATLRDRFIEQVGSEPGMTDREIANRLLGREALQQGVNHVARQLVATGRIVRRQRQDGKIGNYPAGGAGISRAVSTEATGEALSSDFQSEDDVKRGLQTRLEAGGWKVSIVWGRGQGVDVEALRGNA